jgi:hypothetical protein
MPTPKKPSKAVVASANNAIANAADPGPVPGCVWSNNNWACNKTWWWLVFLKQINSAFSVSGAVKMNELAYWNKTASSQARELEAEGLADMMIKGFIEVEGAGYEDGFNYAAALLAMTKTLTDQTKTVCEFAAVNDELFQFFGES